MKENKQENIGELALKDNVTKRKKKKLEHWEIIAYYLAFYDIVAVNFSYFFGLLLRFDLRYSSIQKNIWMHFLSLHLFILRWYLWYFIYCICITACGGSQALVN